MRTNHDNLIINKNAYKDKMSKLNHNYLFNLKPTKEENNKKNIIDILKIFIINIGVFIFNILLIEDGFKDLTVIFYFKFYIIFGTVISVVVLSIITTYLKKRDLYKLIYNFLLFIFVLNLSLFIICFFILIRKVPLTETVLFSLKDFISIKKTFWTSEELLVIFQKQLKKSPLHMQEILSFYNNTDYLNCIINNNIKYPEQIPQLLTLLYEHRYNFTQTIYYKINKFLEEITIAKAYDFYSKFLSNYATSVVLLDHVASIVKSIIQTVGNFVQK